MGAKSGLGLKFLQWFIRGIQFCCAAIVLALTSYFLATLSGHRLNIPTWLRAVEGISGVGVLYTAAGLLLLCCLAGHPFSSFIAIVLDVAFIGAFIYVAQAYRNGANSCTGSGINTVYGYGDANATPQSNTDGSTTLPTFRNACRMETANLAVSIVAIVFFIFSILVEIILVRHRRKEQRFGPSPANNYTSGYGRGGKFMGLFKRRGTAATTGENALPQHTSPDQVRPSYTTDTTAVGQETGTHNKYGESGYGHDCRTAHPEMGTATSIPPAGYRYNDGTYNA